MELFHARKPESLTKFLHSDVKPSLGLIAIVDAQGGTAFPAAYSQSFCFYSGLHCFTITLKYDLKAKNDLTTSITRIKHKK